MIDQNLVVKNPMHDDIYIVEFPKSGVTWLSHIISNIELQLINRDEIATFYNIQKYIIDVHQTKETMINRFLNRTFIKSHSQFNYNYIFVIYLMRHPVDVMVSYYNMMIHSGYKADFETFVKDEAYGVMAWKKHIKSWMYKRNDAQRIHFLKYENLIENTAQEIRFLYKNLGVRLSDKILSKAIQNASLEDMMESEEHYRTYNKNYTMPFIGKKNKKSKSELLTNDIEKYIVNATKDELRELYPEDIVNLQ